MSTAIIAVDAMGGDFGPRYVVPACIASLIRYPSLHIILVGNAQQIELHMLDLSFSVKQRLTVQPAQENIEMSDSPAQILRGKPDASMRVALQLVREGRAHACVSAGNTGALMALSKHILKTLPQIERPAIMTALPTQKSTIHLLDLGANVDCSAEQLLQFAVMGSAAVQLGGVSQPRVALLNVGVESIKGNQQVRQAAELLAGLKNINYIGYIEGDGVYRGEADVVVCDGFVGNVLLKSSEGLARLMAATLFEEVKRTFWRRSLAWLNRNMWSEVHKRWSPDHYNGALLLGVDGVVVKSHGAANQLAIASAIGVATRAVQENLPMRLGQHIQASYVSLSAAQKVRQNGDE